MLRYLFCNLQVSDWIDIISLAINSALAVWIVITIQNNLNNRRVLKDHFINEVKNCRGEYKDFLSRLSSHHVKPKSIAPWFKLMNIKVTDLMSLLHQKYKVDKNCLEAYQVELRMLVTEFDEFVSSYKTNSEIKLKEESLSKIIKFQQNNNGIFNKIIIKINDK